MKHNRIYIAGPMRGLPDYNYPAFKAAAARLRAEGWLVENPAEISEQFGTADEIAADAACLDKLIMLEKCIVTTCDAIYLLQGWENSVGTRDELAIALKMKMPIILESSEESGGAAHSREIDALKSSAAPAPSGAIGNCAKMLEALKQILALAKTKGLFEIQALAETALAEPARNCDVGTEEEQICRHVQESGLECNLETPCHNRAMECRKCFAKWSQLPYKSEVADGK